jgi:hypothetical protein
MRIQIKHSVCHWAAQDLAWFRKLMLRHIMRGANNETPKQDGMSHRVDFNGYSL